MNTATTPPSPVGATDEAAFVAELRRLKARSGMSFRQLQRQASAVGDTLPASTAATMLGKNRLPHEELLVTFLRACGLDEDDMRPWLNTRTRIADGPNADPMPPAPVSPHHGTSPRRSRWRLAIAAAALVTAFAGGAALATSLDGGWTTDEETVVLTP